MNADLSSVLNGAIDTASNAGLSDRSMNRIRRGVSTRRAARNAGRAVATVAAVGAVGSVAVLAGSGRLPFASGERPSNGPSISPSPSGTTEPGHLVSWTPNGIWRTINGEWPDEGPIWYEWNLGVDAVDVIPCGTRLGDLPTHPAITMDKPRVVSDLEEQTILEANYLDVVQQPGPRVRRETDPYTPGGFAWVATWRVDRELLEFAEPGATLQLSGVEDGFVPWDAFASADFNIAFQVWGGFVVVDADSVVVGRGHRANPDMGAGTLTLIDVRLTSSPRYYDHWTLTTNTYKAIEWCPNSPSGLSDRAIAAVAVASSNGGNTVYAWRYFPAR